MPRPRAGNRGGSGLLPRLGILAGTATVAARVSTDLVEVGAFDWRGFTDRLASSYLTTPIGSPLTITQNAQGDSSLGARGSLLVPLVGVPTPTTTGPITANPTPPATPPPPPPTPPVTPPPTPPTPPPTPPAPTPTYRTYTYGPLKRGSARRFFVGGVRYFRSVTPAPRSQFAAAEAGSVVVTFNGSANWIIVGDRIYFDSNNISNIVVTWRVLQ